MALAARVGALRGLGGGGQAVFPPEGSNGEIRHGVPRIVDPHAQEEQRGRAKCEVRPAHGMIEKPRGGEQRHIRAGGKHDVPEPVFHRGSVDTLPRGAAQDDAGVDHGTQPHCSRGRTQSIVVGPRGAHDCREQQGYREMHYRRAAKGTDACFGIGAHDSSVHVRHEQRLDHELETRQRGRCGAGDQVEVDPGCEHGVDRVVHVGMIVSAAAFENSGGGD